MGTRALYGFSYKGESKIGYCQMDGYPDCLGRKMLIFCRKKSLKKMRKCFKKIIMVDLDSRPTQTQILMCMPWLDLNVSNKSADDWYCLLRKTQGEISAYFGKGKCEYMLDSSKIENFEYKYIINLDTGKLEFWSNGKDLTLDSEVDLRDKSEVDEAIDGYEGAY
ncbi:MAG: hypothetical protein LBT59_08705 [Clostridiales bacterium]|jgi:hypothetical protein|nr:hypothetical protein [Clostridiales bacterium]